MTASKKKVIARIIKENRPLTSYEISKIVGCNTKDCENYITLLRKNTGLYTDYTQELVRMYEDLHLVPSKDISQAGIYYLFTKICEKKLKTEGFKILNENDFSIVELDWLRVNYKFTPLNKYL